MRRIYSWLCSLLPILNAAAFGLPGSKVVCGLAQLRGTSRAVSPTQLPLPQALHTIDAVDMLRTVMIHGGDSSPPGTELINFIRT
mmetsp:Transcript_35523/g.86331  ORF Transcript_35523/g.86331 Transcript_35523/m.86331 type:complete len:85 (-) Transcript_35523:21-275(-)